MKNEQTPSRSTDNWVSDYLEPLLSLPTKLPYTAWTGHIPFIFVLMKVLHPGCFVELGVHNGASLIATSTAAKQFGLETRIFGIDSWQGDEHAGYYQGETVYQDLKNYLSVTFPETRLIRGYFSEIRQQFAAGSIDLLHIDGLHTYESVKEDFDTWLDAMSPSGVVMLHDINVYDRGFGVHQLWKELSNRFKTVEFQHCHGLGMLFLGADDARVQPIIELAKNPQVWDLYRNICTVIGEVVPERMSHLEAARQLPVHDLRLAEQDATISIQRSRIAKQDAIILEQRSRLAEQDAVISEQNLLILNHEREISRIDSELNSILRSRI